MEKDAELRGTMKEEGVQQVQIKRGNSGRYTVSRLALLFLCYVGLPKIKAIKAPTITSKIKALNTPTITSCGDRGWLGAPMEKMKVDTKRTVRKNVDTKRAAKKTVKKITAEDAARYVAGVKRSNELYRIEELKLLASPKGSDGFTTHVTCYTLQKYKY
jgi:hypothetical protein